MSAVWPTVPLGDLLRRSERTVLLHPETTYKEVTVRMNGKGVVERRQVQGIEIASDRRYEASAGQFIISRIDARNGASGLIPDELDGAVVTNDFPLFDVAKDRLEPAFLNWMSKTASFVDLCKRASEGTTNRVRLSEDRFKALKIALPSPCEQCRIVARIEELAAKITTTRAIRTQTAEEIDAVTASAANEVFSDARMQGAPVTTLDHVADIRAGVTLGRKLAGKTIRLPYLRVANVQDGRLDLRVIKEVEVYPDEREKWLLCRGDLLLTEGGDWDKLGRGTVWQDELSPCIHQNHIFRVRLDQTKFDPWYVSALVSSPRGKEYFQAASKQTTNLASINQRQLKSFPLFEIPLSKQREIVTGLDALQAKLDTVKTLQAETAAEMDAMLPAILDKAFKGEL
jgi:type I restriction enzyme S subunit